MEIQQAKYNGRIHRTCITPKASCSETIAAKVFREWDTGIGGAKAQAREHCRYKLLVSSASYLDEIV
jgi:hypothetical protein